MSAVAKCPVRSLRVNGREILFYAAAPGVDQQLDEFPVRNRDYVDWIETLPAGSVLFDVGANIGTHALYAAAAGLKVIAFEPAAATVELLRASIALNDMIDAVKVYPIAISDRDGPGTLYLSRPSAAAAMHSFDRQMDVHGRRRAFAYRQPVKGMKLDTFVAKHDISPDYLKVDVDGNEALVIAGAETTLAMVKSLMIELGPHPEHEAIILDLERRGFRADLAQVECSRKRFARYSRRGFADWLWQRCH